VAGATAWLAILASASLLEAAGRARRYRRTRGTSVRNRVVGFESSKVTSLLNTPWMSVPLDVISSTLPVVTCCQKNGLYGTRTRDSGSMARLVMNRLTASSARPAGP
jgi:hypothetical protein